MNKPIALATCYSDLANTALCQRAYAAGIPFVDGVRETLLAFKHLFAYQAFKQRYAERSAMPQQDPERSTQEQAQKQASWRQKLAQNVAHTLEENTALELLSDFSIPTVKRELVNSESELTAAAARLGYPVVLKTAQPGINHKSDQGGVVVGIQSEAGTAASLPRYQPATGFDGAGIANGKCRRRDCTGYCSTTVSSDPSSWLRPVASW